MEKSKKRKNNTGSAVYLGEGRYKPWVARILIGKDKNGSSLYYDIDTFETKLEALVCLENYHKEPYPIYIRENKYNKISTFPIKPYPLIPVKNPNIIIEKKVKKDTYTFKQLYEDFKREKLLTKEEEKIAKKYHIVPERKIWLLLFKRINNSI